MSSLYGNSLLKPESKKLNETEAVKDELKINIFYSSNLGEVDQHYISV